MKSYFISEETRLSRGDGIALPYGSAVLIVYVKEERGNTYDLCSWSHLTNAIITFHKTELIRRRAAFLATCKSNPFHFIHKGLIHPYKHPIRGQILLLIKSSLGIPLTPRELLLSRINEINSICESDVSYPELVDECLQTIQDYFNA